MKKYISATKKEREKLMKVFKCTERMVYLALSFGSDTDLARRIRLGAKNIGCHTYVVTTEMECISDHDGIMRQLLPNGAQIELSKETGKATIIYKGNRVAEYDHVTLAEISAIQQRAMAM
ncbi:hypothetical protein [Muribaculum intestinale]|uniref:hypothetical protein n=1 Tax=Muribaculum intestinale TaxID=1796646 RepID=UPI0025B29FD1|nr:hypothetical protein [Muribaculum intestinale]